MRRPVKSNTTGESHGSVLLTCSAILSTARPSILAKNCNAPLAITVITCIRKSSCYFHEPCTRSSRGYGTSMRVVTRTLLVVPLVVSNLEWVCREFSFRFRVICLDLFRTFMPNNVWHCLFGLTYVAPFCCQIMIDHGCCFKFDCIILLHQMKSELRIG